MDLKIIKYQATNKFLALLIHNEKNEKYYFGFMKTEEPKIIFENNGDYARDYTGAKLLWVDKIELTLSVKAKNMEQRLYSLIEINPSEFDSMYKLLELIFND